MNPQQMTTRCCNLEVTVHYSRTEYSETWWFSLDGVPVTVCRCGYRIEYDPGRIVQPVAKSA